MRRIGLFALVLAAGLSACSDELDTGEPAPPEAAAGDAPDPGAGAGTVPVRELAAEMRDLKAGRTYGDMSAAERARFDALAAARALRESQPAVAERLRGDQP